MGDEKDSSQHTPTNARWEFDDSVTACFDDMLARSIPRYEEMRKAVWEIGMRSLPRSGPRAVLDIGASRGEALASFISAMPGPGRFCAVEVSMPMLSVLRQRFAGDQRIEVSSVDLREGFPEGPFGLVLSVLTLQFTPIEHRLRIVADCYRALAPGGALVLVEKVLGASSDIDARMVAAYHYLKAVNGYGQEEIRKKKLALEGVLVPVTARWNEDMLRSVGFREVDCFWRWMNFAGWVALKP